MITAQVSTLGWKHRSVNRSHPSFLFYRWVSSSWQSLSSVLRLLTPVLEFPSLARSSTVYLHLVRDSFDVVVPGHVILNRQRPTSGILLSPLNHEGSVYFEVDCFMDSFWDRFIVFESFLWTLVVVSFVTPQEGPDLPTLRTFSHYYRTNPQLYLRFIPKDCTFFCIPFI